MRPLTRKRVFAFRYIYDNEETPWNADFGDQIVTDAGIAGETRACNPANTSEGKKVELIYVQFDQPDGTNIPDRHTSRWVPRKATSTSRFGHVCPGCRKLVRLWLRSYSGYSRTGIRLVVSMYGGCFRGRK